MCGTRGASVAGQAPPRVCRNGKIASVRKGLRSRFLRPRLSILENNVPGFMPKSSAALSGPLTHQLTVSNTTKRLLRSRH